MRRLLWPVALILVAGFGVVGLGKWGDSGSSTETVTVSYGDLLDQIAARGRVEAKSTVDLSSKIDGRINSITAGEGAFVKQNQIVITLEDEYARAAVSQARAELKDAEMKAARSKRLFDSNAIPKAHMEDAEVRLDLARAQMEKALVLLNDMSIASPISGKVIAKYREEGESVKGGAPILTIADVSLLRVRAEIDEEDVGRLSLGQEAAITSDAYPGHLFIGKVVEIGSMVGKRSIQLEDPSKIADTKVLEAKIELPSEVDLKLGMTVDIKIESLRRDHVLKIPRKVIRQDKNGPSVFVLRGDRKETRRVVVGAVDRWDAEILEGLHEGEKVVLP